MSKATTAATAEQLTELMQYISSQIRIPTIGVGGGYAPIGTVISYMGTTAPQDYLACDGSTYNIADYQQLATFFTTQFGSSKFFGGDGVTTFKVPDLRGEFLRGTGTNSHANQGKGANVGVHQDATEISCLEIYPDSNVAGVYTKDASTATWNKSTDGSIVSADGYGAHITISKFSSENVKTNILPRPTNTSILWCIKASDNRIRENYSTDEQVIGNWIDGKPLYQRTIITENEMTGKESNWTTVKSGFSTNLSIRNVKILRNKNNGALISVVPWYMAQLYNGNLQLQPTLYPNPMSSNDWANLPIGSYITIQYTKTTD